MNLHSFNKSAMITNGIALRNGYVSTTGQFLKTFWSVRAKILYLGTPRAKKFRCFYIETVMYKVVLLRNTIRYK